jgi:hypothetical protein
MPAGARRAALALVLAAAVGACAGMIADVPALASGETSGPPSETGTSPTGTGTSGSPTGTGTSSSPTGTSTANCPSSNPPNQMTLVAGTPQTITLDAAFASALQVSLANSDGCAVTGAAGVPVTFSAPSTGASGTFAATNSNTVTVGADASGNVAAPTFTANATAGSYTITASSQYGSVSFSLTNAAVDVWCPTLDRRASASAGEPVELTPGVGSTQSTRTGSRFPIRLAVTVTDANGNPVPGVLVTFSAPAVGASGHFTIRSRGAHRRRAHVSRTRTVQVQTSACGIAVAPPFIADRKLGGYIVKASAKPARPAAFALVNEAQ